MGLLRLFLKREVEELISENVRLKVIGGWQALPADLVDMIEQVMARTASNTGPMLVIALNYGSQAEIVAATRRLAERVAAGELTADRIDEAMFESELATHDLPPLDLMIRTSGEQRLSNFLLWQAAYAELLFVDALWPDFNADTLADAIDQFSRRQRRFGGL